MSTRTRALTELPALVQRVVELLSSEQGAAGSLGSLGFSADDARRLVPYLRLIDVPHGSLLIAQGDREHTTHLLLVVEGEVSVDQMAEAGQPVQLSVLGAGQLVGEMSFVDGQPRSMSCTALTEVRAVALSRAALERLLSEEPQTAARFLALVGQRISERLRALSDQLAIYVKLLDGKA